MAGMFAVYHGPARLKAIATDVLNKTHSLANNLRSAGLEVSYGNFFDTFTVSNINAQEIFTKARTKNITLLVIDSKTIGISVDETTSRTTLNEVLEAFGVSHPLTDAVADISLARTSSYLTHEVFNSYHSETAML